MDHLKGKTHFTALENQFKVREICILKQSYKYSKKEGLIAWYKWLSTEIITEWITVLIELCDKKNDFETENIEMDLSCFC